jgi:hypothetical protein
MLACVSLKYSFFPGPTRVLPRALLLQQSATHIVYPFLGCHSIYFIVLYD